MILICKFTFIIILLVGVNYSNAIAQQNVLAGEKVIIDILDDCITSVEQRISPNFLGRTQVSEETAKQLSEGMTGEAKTQTSFWTTDSSLVVQVDQKVPEICSAIAVNLNEEKLIGTFNTWFSSNNRGLTLKKPFLKRLSRTEKYNGVFLAKSMPNGDHVQIAINMHFPSNRTNLFISRVPNSPAAAELLNEKTK